MAGKNFSKTKIGQKLGFRTPDFFKGSVFSGGKKLSPKGNPANFRIQHKG